MTLSRTVAVGDEDDLDKQVIEPRRCALQQLDVHVSTASSLATRLWPARGHRSAHT